MRSRIIPYNYRLLRASYVCIIILFAPLSMKFLPHTKGGTLRPSHVAQQQNAKQIYEECNGDADLWCARMGFELVRSNKLLVAPIESILRKRTIIIRERLSKKEECKAIAHEYAHYVLHAETVAYKHIDRFRINKDEREADLFAEGISL